MKLSFMGNIKKTLTGSNFKKALSSLWVVPVYVGVETLLEKAIPTIRTWKGEFRVAFATGTTLLFCGLVGKPDWVPSALGLGVTHLTFAWLRQPSIDAGIPIWDMKMETTPLSGYDQNEANSVYSRLGEIPVSQAITSPMGQEYVSRPMDQQQLASKIVAHGPGGMGELDSKEIKNVNNHINKTNDMIEKIFGNSYQM